MCYTDLGCFDNAPPFLDLQDRPLSLLPSSREDINTTFLLNTPTNPNESGQQLVSNQDLTTISSSNFDSNLPTKFIIHGYLEVGDLGWMTDMSSAMLSQGSYNVFRVSWDLKPGNDHYAKMSSNARIVGAEIALLIDQLLVRNFVECTEQWRTQWGGGCLTHTYNVSRGEIAIPGFCLFSVEHYFNVLKYCIDLCFAPCIHTVIRTIMSYGIHYDTKEVVLRDLTGRFC